ncbi:MAG: GNAT family N-acetyltransferase [Pseudomonadota bacterium]
MASLTRITSHIDKDAPSCRVFGKHPLSIRVNQIKNERYQFSNYTPKHKRQIAALRSRVFGGTVEQNLNYIEWKYARNPYLDKPHLYVALHQGKVVGVQAMYGNAWIVAGMNRLCVIPCGADFIVDEDHRGQGLGTKLLNFKIKEIANEIYDVAMELSANISSRSVFAKAGFKRIATYETFLSGDAAKPSPFSRALKKISKGFFKTRPNDCLAKFDAWAKESHGNIYGASNARILEMSQLVSHAQRSEESYHLRDEVYYRWRLKNPLAHYRYIYHENDGSLDGYLIIQVPVAGHRATIIDWESSTDEIWCKLVAAAVESGAKPLAIVSPGYTDYQMTELKRRNFVSAVENTAPDRPGPGIYLKTLDSNDHQDNCNKLGDLIANNKLNMRIIASDAF